MLASTWIARLPGNSPVMPLLCNSPPTRSGNQPIIDAIGTTNLGTGQPHIPTGHAPTAPAGPVLRQQGFHLPSRPHRRRPFRCLHRPANRSPRHHERSRRDRQPEPRSRGPRDRQVPNQTQPPGRAQTHRLEEQLHPHLPSLTDIQRRASQPKDIAGTAACDTTRESLTLPDYTHPRST